MGCTIGEALHRLAAAAGDGSLDPLCERHGVRVLSAFGSALHAADPHDLDLGVGFLAGQGDLLALIDDLTVLTGCDALDVAVIDRADPVLRARALSGLGLFEHASGAFATEQMAALAEERDTAWLRRLDLDALAP
jgi:hypothetical protein